MREELVEMAIKFLLHPTIQRSPVSQRRSFLENRGLMTDEIDEAFRRVPDVTSSVPYRQDINSSQDVQSKPFASVQLQGTPQSSQPLAESMLTVSQPSQFSWSYAIVSVVLLILSGAGTSNLLKKFFLPRLKSWIRKVVLEEDDDEETRNKVCLKKRSKLPRQPQWLPSLLQKLVCKCCCQMKKGRHFDVLLRRLGIHIAELRSMSTKVQRLESARYASYKNTDQYGQRTSQNGLDSNLSKSSFVHGDYPKNFPSRMGVFGPLKLGSDICECSEVRTWVSDGNRLASTLHVATFQFVARSGNTAAHLLAKDLSAGSEDRFRVDEAPDSVTVAASCLAPPFFRFYLII
ncbi:Peroxin 14-like protein isoform 3 [Hibiscus syriacus]|uniref:Peroxisomal membrane protein PEX14 n=1 Tax=Hibiscus syriacus TaxID=106335 RepID=A0A6A3ALG0_HIBSY|nr:Peroxin 14-like protein isoform 3 [Hibiscus syriacus]